MGNRIIEIGNLKYCPKNTICSETEGSMPCINRPEQWDFKEPGEMDLTDNTTSKEDVTTNSGEIQNDHITESSQENSFHSEVTEGLIPISLLTEDIFTENKLSLNSVQAYDESTSLMTLINNAMSEHSVEIERITINPPVSSTKFMTEIFHSFPLDFSTVTALATTLSKDLHDEIEDISTSQPTYEVPEAQVTSAVISTTENEKQLGWITVDSEEVDRIKNENIYTEMNVIEKYVTTNKQFQQVTNIPMSTVSQMVTPSNIFIGSESINNLISCTTGSTIYTTENIRFQSDKPTSSRRVESLGYTSSMDNLTIPTSSAENHYLGEEIIDNFIGTEKNASKNTIESTTKFISTTVSHKVIPPTINIKSSTEAYQPSHNLSDKQNTESKIHPIFLLFMVLDSYNAAATDKGTSLTKVNPYKNSSISLPTSKLENTSMTLGPPTSCTEYRRYPSIICDLYYECVRIMWWYQIELKNCPEGESFHPHKLLCIPSDDCSID